MEVFGGLNGKIIELNGDVFIRKSCIESINGEMSSHSSDEGQAWSFTWWALIPQEMFLEYPCAYAVNIYLEHPSRSIDLNFKVVLPSLSPSPSPRVQSQTEGRFALWPCFLEMTLNWLPEHLHFGQVGLECCSVHLLEKPLHCSDFCSTNSYLGWMLPIWRVDPFLGVLLHWVCLLTKSSWRFTSWFAKAHQAQKRKTFDIFGFHLQKCRLNKVLIEWIYFI